MHAHVPSLPLHPRPSLKSAAGACQECQCRLPHPSLHPRNNSHQLRGRRRCWEEPPTHAPGDPTTHGSSVTSVLGCTAGSSELRNNDVGNCHGSFRSEYFTGKMNHKHFKESYRLTSWHENIQEKTNTKCKMKTPKFLFAFD